MAEKIKVIEVWVSLWAGLCKLRKCLGQIVLPPWLLDNVCGLSSHWDTEALLVKQCFCWSFCSKRNRDSLVWKKIDYFFQAGYLHKSTHKNPQWIDSIYTFYFLLKWRCPLLFCLIAKVTHVWVLQGQSQFCLLSQNPIQFNICRRILNFSILLLIVALK